LPAGQGSGLRSRSAQVESQAGATGSIADLAREVGIRSLVVAPIVVEGRLWGQMGAGSTLEEPLPPDAEPRLASFTELVATAIANADNRAQLMASRLGLRDRIEALGGTLEVTSPPGDGTTLLIQIPAESQESGLSVSSCDGVGVGKISQRASPARSGSFPAVVMAILAGGVAFLGRACLGT
jgi:GAF domain-containing protein